MAGTSKTRRPKRKAGSPDDSLAALIAKAKKDPTSLTPAEIRQLLALKKLRDAGDLGGDYLAHRERMADRARSASRVGREIGPIPKPKHSGCRRRGLRDFRYFCEHYFSGRFFLPWGMDHPKVLAKIQRCVERGEMMALAMPRGSGKTSLIECAALWAMLKGVERYIAIVASIRGKGADILDSIKTELMTNQALHDDFPEVCHPIWALEGVNQRARGQLCQDRPTAMSWQKHKLVLPTVPRSRASGSIFHVAGLKSAEILGLKHTISLDDGTTTVIRPQLVIADDPQTPESARSPAQCARRERILTSSVLGMAGPRTKMTVFALVTVIEAGDLADSLLDREKHPEWQGERFKAVYTFSSDEKDWARYADLYREGLKTEQGTVVATEFYRERREKMDKDAVVGWRDRYYADEISGLQHAMNVKIQNEHMFASEYQNSPIIESEQSDLLSADEIAAKVSGYKRGVVPASCEKLVVNIDVHDKLLYWTAVAWADNFTGYVVDYGTFPDQRQVYFTLRSTRRSLKSVYRHAGREAAMLAGLKDLAAHLAGRTWTRDDGATIPISRVLVDAGHERDVVYEFVRTADVSVRLVPTFGRGIGASRKPMAQYTRKRGEKLTAHWYMPAAQRGEGAVRHLLVDTNYWKTFLHARLAVAVGDPGALSFYGKSAAAHRLIADHLRAEYPVRTSGPWGTVDEWKHPPDQPDNHWLDCLVGSCVGASMENVRLPGSGEPAPKTRRKVTLAELKRRAG